MIRNDKTLYHYVIMIFWLIEKKYFATGYPEISRPYKPLQWKYIRMKHVASVFRFIPLGLQIHKN